jgi:hypothetical protein
MKSLHAKQYILAALTAGFVIASTSFVAAQPMTENQGQKHQKHQSHQRQNRQGHQRHQRQNHQGHQRRNKSAMGTPVVETPVANARTLPPVPTNLPTRCTITVSCLVCRGWA